MASENSTSGFQMNFLAHLVQHLVRDQKVLSRAKELGLTPNDLPGEGDNLIYKVLAGVALEADAPMPLELFQSHAQATLEQGIIPDTYREMTLAFVNWVYTRNMTAPYIRKNLKPFLKIRRQQQAKLDYKNDKAALTAKLEEIEAAFAEAAQAPIIAGDIASIMEELTPVPCDLFLAAQDYLPDHPQILKGLWYQGDTMALHASSQDVKSWLLLRLALCVSTGRRWLGIETTKAKVLYLNFELDEQTIKQRIDMLAEELEKTEWIDVVNLRDVPIAPREFRKRMRKLIPQLRQGGYGLIIFDIDANARRKIPYGVFRDICDETKAGMVYGPRYSEESDAGKHAAWGGPQVILTVTELEEKGAFMVKASGEYGIDVAPFVIRLDGAKVSLDDALLELKSAQTWFRTLQE